MKSWKAEVIADDSEKWVGNLIRFANKEDAELYALNLASRWMSVREWRVIESEDEPNYKFDPNGELERE
jgi:hypothetical protein